MPVSVTDEAARLGALHELAILDTAPEQLYDDVVALAAAVCEMPIAIINFVDTDRQWGKALIGLASQRRPRPDDTSSALLALADHDMYTNKAHARAPASTAS